MGKDDRFIRTYTQGNIHHIEIWIDKVTGVNYVYCIERGYCGGMTPLIDKDGKPVVTPQEEIEKL